MIRQYHLSWEGICTKRLGKWGGQGELGNIPIGSSYKNPQILTVGNKIAILCIIVENYTSCQSGKLDFVPIYKTTLRAHLKTTLRANLINSTDKTTLRAKFELHFVPIYKTTLRANQKTTLHTNRKTTLRANQKLHFVPFEKLHFVPTLKTTLRANFKNYTSCQS